ncbi:uncharacterized protein METZ01_LOCUS283134, partial [marine metagenome]
MILFFRDAGPFSCQAAQVIQFGPPHPAPAQYLD